MRQHPDDSAPESGPDSNANANADADDRQAERWVALLRDGTPVEKAVARRGLAHIFEAKGLVAEAIDLLVANAREGYRDAESFQALSRLYRAQGDEYLAASAALEATRLSGQRAPAEPTERREAPWRQPADAPPPGPSDDAEASGPEADRPSQAPQGAPSWRRPAQILGWLAVVATLFAAAMVARSSVWSAGLYLISATLLTVLLSGSLTLRGLLRLPVGPLGDGALLFGWLLLLLVAGALAPRTGDVFVNPGSTTPIPTPGLYRTPVATPTTAPTAAPTTVPAASPSPPS